MPTIHSPINGNSILHPQHPSKPLPCMAASPIEKLPVEVFQKGISDNLSVRDLSAVYLTGGTAVRALVQESWNRISNPSEAISLTRNPNRGPGVKQAADVLATDLNHAETQLDEETLKQISAALDDVVMPDHQKVDCLKPVIEEWAEKFEIFQSYFLDQMLTQLAQYPSKTLQRMGLEALAEKLSTTAAFVMVPLFDCLLRFDPSLPKDATPVKDLYAKLGRDYHGDDLTKKMSLDEMKEQAVTQFLADTQSEQKQSVFKCIALQGAAALVPRFVNCASPFKSQPFIDSQQQKANLLFEKIYEHAGQLGSQKHRNQVCSVLRNEIGWLRPSEQDKQEWLAILADKP